MTDRKFWLAVRILPSGVNSITAWARDSASSFPLLSRLSIFDAVISVANLITLTALPRFMIGL
ncbi:hypothetical protein D3C87_2154140 [compost metagenome]